MSNVIKYTKAVNIKHTQYIKAKYIGFKIVKKILSR